MSRSVTTGARSSGLEEQQQENYILLQGSWEGKEQEQEQEQEQKQGQDVEQEREQEQEHYPVLQEAGGRSRRGGCRTGVKHCLES